MLSSKTAFVGFYVTLSNCVRCGICGVVVVMVDCRRGRHSQSTTTTSVIVLTCNETRAICDARINEHWVGAANKHIFILNIFIQTKIYSLTDGSLGS